MRGWMMVVKSKMRKRVLLRAAQEAARTCAHAPLLDIDADNDHSVYICHIYLRLFVPECNLRDLVTYLAWHQPPPPLPPCALKSKFVDGTGIGHFEPPEVSFPARAYKRGLMKRRGTNTSLPLIFQSTRSYCSFCTPLRGVHPIAYFIYIRPTQLHRI